MYDVVCASSGWPLVGRQPEPHRSPKWVSIRERNYALAQQIGEAPYLCYALEHLAFYHRQRAELRLACGLGQRAVALAQGQHPTVLLTCAVALALTLMLCGDFSARLWAYGGDHRPLP